MLGLPLINRKTCSMPPRMKVVFPLVLLLILSPGLFVSVQAAEQAPPENRSYGFFMTLSDEQLEAMPFVNSSWVRLAGVSVWNTVEIEPGSGVYDFSVSDSVVGEAKALNLSLLLTINPVHSLDAGANSKALPTNMSAYKAFVSAFVERYDGDGTSDAPGSPVVRYWQISNEPDNSSEWTDTAANFALLVKETASAIRAADPTAHIVLGGLARGVVGLTDFYEPMLTALDGYGGGPYFDIFDVHWFGRAATNDYLGLANVVTEIRNTLGAHGYAELPVWATEVATYSGTPTNYPTQTEVEQARDLAKRLLYYRKIGLDKVFWEIYREFHEFKGVPNGYFDNTGIVNNPLNDGDSSKKKSFYTYSLLAEKLDGAIVQNGTTFMQEIEESVLEGCEFSNFGRTFYTIWIDNPELVGTELSLPTTYEQLTVYRLVPDASNVIPGEIVPIVDGIFHYTLDMDPILLEYEGDGPALTVSAPINGLLVNTPSVNVAGSTDPLEPVLLEVYGNASLSMTADGSGNFSFSSIPLKEGNNALTLTAGSGLNTRSKTCYVIRDTIVPVITVTYPEAGTVLNSSVIALEGLTDMGQDVTFTNPPGGTPLIATGNIVNKSFIFAEQTFTEGVKTVTLSATDDAGNSTTASSSFEIDTTPPSITGVTVLQNTYEKGPYVVEATITDNDALLYAMLAYTINGGGLIEAPMALATGNTWRGGIPTQPVDTNITYFVKARDIAGNIATNPSSSSPISFKVIPALVEIITAVPVNTSVSRGGTLQVTITLRNPYKISTTTNVKIIVTLPNKSQTTVLNSNVTLSANATKSQLLSHSIPTMAPVGTYTYDAIASDLLGTELDRDSFNFTVR